MRDGRLVWNARCTTRHMRDAQCAPPATLPPPIATDGLHSERNKQHDGVLAGHTRYSIRVLPPPPQPSARQVVPRAAVHWLQHAFLAPCAHTTAMCTTLTKSSAACVLPQSVGRSRGWGERPPPAARHVTGRGAHCSTPLSASHRHTSTCRGSAPSEQCSRVCPTHCPQQQHTAPRRGRLSAPLVHCTSVFARRALAHAGHAGSGRRAAPITFYCDARRGRCPSTATATTHSRLLPDAACRSRQCPPAQREHAGALAARPPARGRCS